MPPVEGDVDGAIDVIDATKLECELDVSLLGEITRNEHERVKEKLDKRSIDMAAQCSSDSVNNSSTHETRSHHMLTKNRPKA